MEHTPNTSESYERKRYAFETELKRLESITDMKGTHIEAGVIEQCAYLNCLQIYTRQSCEGHVDWGHPYPSIDFSSQNNPALQEYVKEDQDRQHALIEKIQAEAIRELGITIDFARTDKTAQEQFLELESVTQEKLVNLIGEKQNAEQERIDLTVYKYGLDSLGITPPGDIIEAEELRKWCSHTLTDDQYDQVMTVKIPEDFPNAYLLNQSYYRKIAIVKTAEYDAKELKPRLMALFKDYVPEDEEFCYMLSFRNENITLPDLIPKITSKKDTYVEENPLEIEDKEEFLMRSRKAFAHFSEYLKRYYYREE